MKEFTESQLRLLSHDSLVKLVLTFQKSHQALIEINESNRQMINETRQYYERTATERHRAID